MKPFLYLCTIKLKTTNIMKAKKTVNISDLIDYANIMLALPTSDFVTFGYKDGIISMLEKILHEAKAYKGFMFMNNDDCKINTFGHVSRKYFK